MPAIDYEELWKGLKRAWEIGNASDGPFGLGGVHERLLKISRIQRKEMGRVLLTGTITRFREYYEFSIGELRYYGPGLVLCYIDKPKDLRPCTGLLERVTNGDLKYRVYGFGDDRHDVQYGVDIKELSDESGTAVAHAGEVLGDLVHMPRDRWINIRNLLKQWTCRQDA